MDCLTSDGSGRSLFDQRGVFQRVAVVTGGVPLTESEFSVEPEIR